MLTVYGLNQYYGGSHILRDLNFDIPKGACTTVLGRNGVGKTTLLKCLMGLLPLRSGVLTFDGRDVTALPPYARARGAGLPRHVFEMFPVLKEMLRRRGGDLSGGQQQLSIARALVSGPKMLILDDPTEGIQPSIINDIGNVISTLTKSGEMAILLVERYYDFAKSLADHYLVMSRGEIIKRGAGRDMDARRRAGMSVGLAAALKGGCHPPLRC